MAGTGFDPPRASEAWGTITLVVVSGVLSVLRLQGRDLDALAVDPAHLAAEPWRAFTATLLHGNTLHLLFNLYWVWRLGAVIETNLGTGLFALLVLVTGPFPMAAEVALFRGGIGLSGIVYGLVGFLWALDRWHRRFRGALDPGLPRFFLLWFFLCIGFTLTGVLPVANVAHGAGGVLGALLGWTVCAPRLARVATLAGALALCALAGTVARPWVNLLGAGAQEDFREGTTLLELGEDAAAVEHLERAVAREPGYAGAWHNLGIGYRRLGRMDEAYEAHRRAVELDARTPLYRGALAEVEYARAAAALDADDTAGALLGLERATALDPEHGAAWYALVELRLAEGRAGAARAAFDEGVKALGDDPERRARWQELLERLRAAEEAAEGASAAPEPARSGE